ncbi:MAG: PAS domain-containing protein [Legionellales bacterium]|jgi:two-component system, OmpR family, aerobic respiration control sensor histidine kinase ArcB|nr:PAS domain-containing protein [Legionellales bacterium]
MGNLDIFNVIFMLSMFVNALLFIPQSYRIYKNKSARSISPTTFAGFLVIQTIVLINAFINSDIFLICCMAFSMITCSSVLVVSFLYGTRKNSIEDISASEILDLLPCHVYWKNKDGTYIGANKASLENNNNILGARLHDFLAKSEADRIMVLDHEVMVNKKENLEGMESGHDQFGNKKIYLSSKSPLLDETGNVIGLLGVLFDYTDVHMKYKEKSDFLESIVASLPGHVYWTDNSGYYLGCNNAMAYSLGLLSRNDIIGKKARNMPVIIDPETVESNNLKVIENRSNMVVEEKSLREDGSIATMLAHKKPLHNKDNDIEGLLVMSVDITELKLEQDRLAKAAKDADIANKVKYSFIANMSHDIRTPMSGIISMAEAIVAKNDEYSSSGNDLVQAGNRLLDLLNEIIEISQIGSSNLEVTQKKFNLKNIISNIIDISIPAAYDKKIAIKFDFDKSIPKEVISDPIRIHRIVLNLISNAIKFTDKGHINICIYIAQEDENRIVLKFSIQDTGVGIPKDQHEHIFAKFNKLAESCSSSSYQGLGLGLSIVKGFVNDLNGEIYVNSEVGVGSEFIAYLPFQVVLVENEKEINYSDIETVKSYNDGLNINNTVTCNAEKNNFTIDGRHRQLLKSLEPSILLVDDDQLVQTATKLLLNNFGCNVTIASDGNEALTKIANEKFDLVFMDIGLPDISGFNVIDKIRAKLDNANKDLPIIVFTAHVDLHSLGDIPDTITDIYNKPMTMDLCENILAKYLLKKLSSDYVGNNAELIEG